VRAAGEGLEASLRIAWPASLPEVTAVLIRPAGETSWRDLSPSRYWMERHAVAVVFPIRGPVEIRILTAQ
jgi:hypothetical protein